MTLKMDDIRLKSEELSFKEDNKYILENKIDVKQLVHEALKITKKRESMKKFKGICKSNKKKK